jgi:hypothetical protein
MEEEKELKKRFEILLKRKLTKNEIKLFGIGRHFIIKDNWIVLGRDKKENEELKKIKAGKLLVPKTPGPSARVIGTDKKSTKELIKAYSKDNSKNKKEFEKFKI